MVVLLIVALSVLAYKALLNRSESNKWVDHIQAMLMAANEFVAARGHVMTGEGRNLETYREAF